MLKETKELTGETAPFVATGILWYGVLAVALTGISYGIYWFVAPAKVAIENRTFHQSQAYTDGMARDLDNWRMSYASADADGKAAIRATLRHRFAGYDINTLPADDQLFIRSIMQ